MDRRFFLAASLGLAAGCDVTADREAPRNRLGRQFTTWELRSALALDACFAATIAAAPADLLQVRAHPKRRADYRAMFGKVAMQRTQNLMAALAGLGAKDTPGAELALLASAGDLSTFSGLRATFSDPSGIRRAFAGTPFWQGDEYHDKVARLAPIAIGAFEAIAAAGFEKEWHRLDEPAVSSGIHQLSRDLTDFDPVAEHLRFLRREFKPAIVVYVSKLSEPHGIRILGQRFVTSPDYPSEIVKRNAVHELIHPFLDAGRPESQRIVFRLNDDPLLRQILARAGSGHGYGSLDGLVEEGATQALEAVINRRLGVGRDQRQYWRDQDGGIHLFAAAVFARMQSTGFAERGGDALAWLDQEIDAGALRGESLQVAAAGVVGEDAVRRWQR